MRDLPKYKDSKITKEQVDNLHKLLVQTTIDYLKKENIDEVWEVCFSADGLDWSVEYGEWTPSTDSCMTLIGLQEDDNKTLGGKPIRVRKIIAESM